MNIIKATFAPAVVAAALAFTACSDKTTPVLVEQTERLNSELHEMVTENPDLIASASANFADAKISIDVKLADSLFAVSQISEPLFNYFTACEVKNHLDKNLEITVNALTEVDGGIVVNLNDVYGDSHSYEISAASLRRMVKSPLTQLDYNEAREGLFAALDASKEQFCPSEGKVKSISTSFKGGFFAYDVEFDSPASYKGVLTANLKSRALKVLEKRYAKLGTFKPVVFGMYKSLGVEGFHLIYSAGEGKPQLKTTITLNHIH